MVQIKDLGKKLVEGKLLMPNDLGFIGADKSLIKALYNHPKIISPETLANFLGRHFNMLSVIPVKMEISQEVLGLLPGDIAKRLNLLPVALDSGILTVVMVDPWDEEDLDALRDATRKIIRPVLSFHGPGDIKNKIEEVYK